MEIGFAMCGSFCTFSQVFPVMEELTKIYNITPVFSEASDSIDSRFGTAEEHRLLAISLCGKTPIHTIAQAEPTVLLETLADKFAACCVQEFGAVRATVELHKYILPNPASVSVRTTAGK